MAREKPRMNRSKFSRAQEREDLRRNPSNFHNYLNEGLRTQKEKWARTIVGAVVGNNLDLSVHEDMLVVMVKGLSTEEDCVGTPMISVYFSPMTSQPWWTKDAEVGLAKVKDLWPMLTSHIPSLMNSASKPYCVEIDSETRLIPITPYDMDDLSGFLELEIIGMVAALKDKS